ncbi:hypothetical protein FX988_04243 [Paraglaciecola mesophila]|uniref:Uncharacterized protein n=1 Tax=Paraglaciecola mesophila TaxID=197222 RepID=A0A857JR84_9ALTE|nr:hypothetical protein FX988_04243 [Paraglaciecola mesophila]
MHLVSSQGQTQIHDKVHAQGTAHELLHVKVDGIEMAVASGAITSY